MGEEGAYLAVLGGAAWVGVLVAVGREGDLEGVRVEGPGVCLGEVPGAAVGVLALSYRQASQEAS